MPGLGLAKLGLADICGLKKVAELCEASILRARIATSSSAVAMLPQLEELAGFT